MDKEKEVKRFDVDLNYGLNKRQVSERFDEGLYNYDTTVKTKTIRQIVREHTLTLFNFLNLALAICVIFVGSYKNVTFLGVIICNVIIVI